MSISQMFEEFIDNLAISNKPVSYTHLDVYKRQSYTLLLLSFLDIRIDNTINGDNLEKPYKLNDNTSVTSFIDISVSYTHLDLRRQALGELHPQFVPV